MPSRVVVDDDEQIIADLLKRVRRLETRQTTTRPYGTHDEFTVAATPETEYQLTYIPVSGTCAMYVNGLEQEEGTDYTVDYDTTSGTVGLVTFVTGLTTGDQINFRYLVTDWLVARSLPEETDAPVIGNLLPTGNDSEFGPGAQTVTSGSLTVTAGRLLVCVFTCYGYETGAPMSISDNHGLTWTAQADTGWVGSSSKGRYGRQIAYTTIVDADDAAFTVSVHATVSVDLSLGYVIWEMSDFDAASPVGVTGTNSEVVDSPPLAASTAYSFTVTPSGTPAANSAVITTMFKSYHAGLTNPSSEVDGRYTLEYSHNDTSFGSGGAAVEVGLNRNGAADADWSPTSTSYSPGSSDQPTFVAAALIFEVKAG